LANANNCERRGAEQNESKTNRPAATPIDIAGELPVSNRGENKFGASFDHTAAARPGRTKAQGAAEKARAHNQFGTPKFMRRPRFSTRVAGSTSDL